MENDHVLSGLVRKRAELAGELIALEARTKKIRADLAALDGAICIFDPVAAPQKIRPILRRKPPTFFAHGAASRAILTVLRLASEPLTARQIAQRLAVEHRLDVGNVDAMNRLVNKVRNSLARHNGGALASEKHGDTVVWRVA